MKNILFINPGNGKNYQGLFALAPALSPPTWILLMADYCRRNGNEVVIHDANIRGWNIEGSTAKEVISAYNPKLVVIWVAGHNPSASTQTMPIAGRIADDLKSANPKIPIAIGGVHPSALPERTLREESVDWIITGEGFRSVSNLAKNPKEWMTVLPSRSLGKNLDQNLNGYAWDLLSPGGLNNYRVHDHHVFQDMGRSKKPDLEDIRSPYASIYTSLGCPYSCNFCVTPGFFDHVPTRYWSPEVVVGWIDELVKRYEIRNIRIEDDNFLSDLHRVGVICDLLIDRKHNLNLWCYGRVEIYDILLLRKMEKAGFKWICIGIESAKGKTKASAKESVERIKLSGMNVLGNFMFGLPGENLKDMEDTLFLAIQLQCEFSNFYCCMPLPGSQLYKEAERKDRLPPSWASYSQLGYDCQPMGTEYLRPVDILRFRDHAFKTYYSNDVYLEMMDRRFGEKVRGYIEKMAQSPIRRRLLG